MNSFVRPHTPPIHPTDYYGQIAALKTERNHLVEMNDHLSALLVEVQARLVRCGFGPRLGEQWHLEQVPDMVTAALVPAPRPTPPVDVLEVRR